MKITRAAIPDILVIDHDTFTDSRGHFFEAFNQKIFADATGYTGGFAQDNQSHSVKKVLRGLHYQIQKPQGKLVRVIQGSVFDVAVDIRKSSATFGKWVGMELSAENRRQMWIPAGFAHGFVVLSETADFLYKITDYHFPQGERAIAWNDPTIDIKWPVNDPVLSAKDQQAPLLQAAEVYS